MDALSRLDQKITEFKHKLENSKGDCDETIAQNEQLKIELSATKQDLKQKDEQIEAIIQKVELLLAQA